MLKLISQGVLCKTHELSLSHRSLPGRPPLCLSSAAASKLPHPTRPMGKSIMGFVCFGCSSTQNHKDGSITNFWSELIKSRDRQTWREVSEKSTEQLKTRGEKQPENLGQKSRKHYIRNGWKWVGLFSLEKTKITQTSSPQTHEWVEGGYRALCLLWDGEKESCFELQQGGGWH